MTSFWPLLHLSAVISDGPGMNSRTWIPRVGYLSSFGHPMPACRGLIKVICVGALSGAQVGYDLTLAVSWLNFEFPGNSQNLTRSLLYSL